MQRDREISRDIADIPFSCHFPWSRGRVLSLSGLLVWPVIKVSPNNVCRFIGAIVRGTCPVRLVTSSEMLSESKSLFNPRTVPESFSTRVESYSSAITHAVIGAACVSNWNRNQHTNAMWLTRGRQSAKVTKTEDKRRKKSVSGKALTRRKDVCSKSKQFLILVLLLLF